MSLHPVEVEMLSRQYADRYVTLKTKLCEILDVPWKLGGDRPGAESGMRDVGVIELVTDLKAKSKAVDEFVATLKHLDMISRNDAADNIYSYLRKELRKLGLESTPGESNG